MPMLPWRQLGPELHQAAHATLTSLTPTNHKHNRTVSRSCLICQCIAKQRGLKAERSNTHPATYCHLPIHYPEIKKRKVELSPSITEWLPKGRAAPEAATSPGSSLNPGKVWNF